MLLPTPTRLLHLAVLGGATFGFFKFFRVEGLDQLALSLRDGVQVQTGWNDNTQIPSLPWNLNSSAQAPFPSTRTTTNVPAPGMSSPWNSSPVDSAAPTNVQAPSQDRWVNSNPNAYVQNAKFSAELNQTPNVEALVHRESKITLGTIDLHQMNSAKLRDPILADRLAQILADFSCVAVQNLDASDELLLPELMQVLKASGKWYEFISSSTSTAPTANNLVIIYDAEQLEADRNQTYSLRDETGVLQCAPLVGWFRTKAEVPRDAFTFTFVNAQLVKVNDINQTDFLPDMLNSIAVDGRNEDDIIIAGSFADSNTTFETLRRQGCKILMDDTVSGSGERLSLVLSPTCREFKGKNGAFNILRRYNLTPSEAFSISKTPPVWAEFATVEADLY